MARWAMAHPCRMQSIEPNVRARKFSLLVGRTACQCCQALIEVGALWLDEFEDLDGQAMDPGGAATLSYMEWLEAKPLAACQERLPGLRMASTRMSGTTYLANHCLICGSVQGAHFVHGPDGPFWPDADESLAAGIRKFDFAVPLSAVASISQATWMDRVG